MTATMMSVADMTATMMFVASSCGGTAWNAAVAAPTLSALAGLISGFVFAGMVVLLVERQQQSVAARIPALIQFFAAFVALGLNAYMFGLIAGEDAQACRRIWTATVISSGMLAAGTVAAVGGIVLLVHAYLADQRRISGVGNGAPPVGTQFDLLTRLLRGAFLLIAWMVTLLLLARAGEALWVWLGRDLLSVVPLIVIGALVTLFAVIARSAWKPTVFQPREPTDPHVRQLYLAASATVLYAVVGTVVVGALLSVVNGDWNRSNGWVVWLAVVPALVIPSGTIVLFAKGVEGLTRSWSDPPSQKAGHIRPDAATAGHS